MNAPLYNTGILRLATSNPFGERLANPMASVEKRSPVCGSRVTVDVNLDAEGRVSAIGMHVSACVFGQASATLLAKGAIGASPERFAATRDAIAAWLAGAGDMPDWPGLAAIEPVLPHTARHAAIRLAFEAAAEAAVTARARA
jgi:NifU-like protein involved in Fe-S cluster formation